MKVHMTLNTLFGRNQNAEIIKVMYLIVYTHLTYNIIMGMPTLNLLGYVLLPFHLRKKYLPPNRRVGVVQRDQKSTQKCYYSRLEIRKVRMVVAAILQTCMQEMNVMNLDFKIEPEKERLTTT